MAKIKNAPDTWLTRTARTVLKRDFIRNLFLAFFILMMIQLWLFARWALGLSETYVPRPNAVAGFVPIGAYLSLFTWLKSGVWETVIPAGRVIVIAAILMSVLLKRGFCGWVCPVGAFFQIPANLGRRLRKNRELKVNKWVDYALRGFRDLLAVAFVLFLWFLMPLPASLQFFQDPFYAAADIKIVEYFVSPPLWWILAGLLVVGLSVLYGNVWCRWLCPLGGIYSTLGIFSVSNIVRNQTSCVDCGKCARVCPNRIPVDKLIVVRATECDGCQTCVQACPISGALNARVGTKTVRAWWVWPLLALALWFGIYFLALATGNWNSSMPVEYFREAIRAVGL
jgi:polyferredoxin